MKRTGRQHLGPVLAAGALALLAACAQGQAGEPSEALAPRELVVRTVDYRFEMPDTVQGGPTRIRLVNAGPDYHHVWLVRLEEGADVERIIAELSDHRPLPAGAVAVGGPNTPGAPGEETNATLDLAAGEYLVVCVIPGMTDGELHVAKGMVRRLTVLPAGPSERLVAMPEADVVMTLDDYRYELSEPLRAGRQRIRVVNAAQQSHEVVIVALEPGRTAADFLGFLQSPEGAPPGRLVGGVTWLDRGESNVIELDLEPGEYALLCFVPDAGDGNLHLAHGMIRQIRVD